MANGPPIGCPQAWEETLEVRGRAWPWRKAFLGTEVILMLLFKVRYGWHR